MEEKKEYEKPSIEIVLLNGLAFLATSRETDSDGDNLEWDWFG